jgi:molecular chaperone GrpE
MSQDSEKGTLSADIPEDAIADAVAAVEKRARGRDGGSELQVEVDASEPGEAEEGPLGELDKLRLELEMSQERGRKVFEQLKEEHERLLRTAADLDNYKKRAARERDEITRYGNERLVKEVLPALDNLERALAAAAGREDPLADGVRMTRRLLEESLGRFGVKGFSAKGQLFDPRLHEALMTVETADAAPGTVVEEQQRGYFLHERLIRPAAVLVAAAPQGAVPGREEAGAADDKVGGA